MPSGYKTGFELIHQYAFEVIDFSSQYGSENGTGYTARNLVGPVQVYPNYCDSSLTCSFRTYGSWWRECPSALTPIHSTPEGYTSEDYVDLYFDIPVVPVQLQIFETYNPGAVVRILGCYRTQPVDEPVNARKLQWITLWKASSSSLVSHVSGNPVPRLQWDIPETPDDALYDRSLALVPFLDGSTVLSLRRQFSSHPRQCLRPHSRIFQPTLRNVPPYPLDLIRLEFDSVHCGYYTELDAVRLSGWAQCTGWSGFTQLEGAPSDQLNTQPCRSPLHLDSSFFSDLLRPLTPHLLLPIDQTGPLEGCSNVSPSASPPILSPNTSRVTGYIYPPYMMSSVVNAAHCILPSSSTSALCSSDVDERNICRLPSAGIDVLVPRVGNMVSIPPGVICPSALFGLIHVNESAAWRHGPITRLPYEVLLRIFSFLDLTTLCRTARVSRQFRCLADDALAQLSSLNLQYYCPWITDFGLLSLGRRLGRVNLTALAAALITTGSSVAPSNFLRRLQLEEGCHQGSRRRLQRRELAARVRSWSSSAAVASSPNDANRQTATTQLSTSMDSDIHSHELHTMPTENDLEQEEPVADFIEAYKLAYPRCRLRRLDMSWCGNYSQISPTAFGNFLSDACRLLTTLRLSSCKFLNDDCLLHIVNLCPYLLELDLSSCTGVTSYGFLVLGRLIHLNWLSLYRTHITNEGLLSVAELCQHLQHVNLGSCMDVQNMDMVLERLTQNNPGLLSLSLWRCVTVSSTGINHIALYCPALEELDIGWCRNIPLTQDERANCVLRLVERCVRLRKLFLSGLSLLNSEELVTVGRLLRNQLEQLDIHGSRSVTGAAVAALLIHCPRLLLLDISFCPELDPRHVLHLRRLFPYCSIISATPNLIEDHLGDPINQVIIDELPEGFENPWDAPHFRPLIPRALPGGPGLLALPAPVPLPAIAGPSPNSY